MIVDHIKQWVRRGKHFLSGNTNGLVYLAIVLSLAYTVFEFNEDIAHDDAIIQRQIELNSRMAALNLESYFRSWEKALSGIAETSCLRTKDAGICRDLFQRLPARFPDVINLAAIDRDGLLYASTLLSAGYPGKSEAASNFFHETKNGRPRHFIDPQTNTLSNEEGGMATRLSGHDGRFDGLFVITFRFDELRRHALNGAISDEMEVLIVNRQTRVIDAPRRHRLWIGKTLRELAGEASMPTSGGATFDLRDGENQYNAHLRWVADDGWGVVAYRKSPGLVASMLPKERMAFIYFLPIALLVLILSANMMRARRAETALNESENLLRTALAETEIKVIERTQMLTESEARYRTLYDQAPCAFAILDTKGNIIDVNENTSSITGYSRAELLQLNVNAIATIESPEKTLGRIDTELPCEANRQQTTAQRKDGSRFPVMINACPIPRSATSPPRLLTIWSDLSEIKQSQDRLRFSQKMEAVGILAGGIAHDFNNLLAIVMGHAQLVHDTAIKDSPTQSYAQKITKAATRARSIIRQLLDFSRNSDEAPRTMSLATELAEIETLIVASHPRHIKLSFTVEDLVKPINAVPHQVQQVIINLINNACDAIGTQEGTVDVSLSEENRVEDNSPIVGKLETARYAVLRIKDSGPGISEAALNEIFLPFFTTKEVGRGTGLGLAVVRGIMEEAHGAIRVLNRPSGGCCFELFFPLSQGAVEHMNQLSPTSQGHAEKVLLVDDEADVVEAYIAFLKHCGYCPLFANSGYEALQIIATQGHDIRAVITDLVMPEMDGLELAATLQTILPRLPVLLLTGRSDRLSTSTLAESKIVGVITKPVEPQVIASELRRAIDESALDKA